MNEIIHRHIPSDPQPAFRSRSAARPQASAAKPSAQHRRTANSASAALRLAQEPFTGAVPGDDMEREDMDASLARFLWMRLHEVERYNATLQQAHADLEQFMRIVAHELKEPLRGLRGYAELLHTLYGNRLDGDGIEMLDALVHSADRLHDLVGDLRQYMLLGEEQAPLETVDVTTAVHAVLEQLAGFLNAEMASVRMHGSLPQVHAHPAHIQIIFRNLITNGIKYNERARKRVDIGLVAGAQMQRARAAARAIGVLPPPSRPIFYVSDNGIGIDAQFHAEIFKMFRRLHASGQYGGGDGAGLAFVDKLIRHYDGAIWLESERGVGTTFYFTLDAMP